MVTGKWSVSLHKCRGNIRLLATISFFTGESMRHIFNTVLILWTATAPGAEIDFAHDVVPILKKHCAECHTDKKSEGGFSFTTRRLLLESEHVNLQSPEKSRLLQLVASADSEVQMPPKGRDRVPAEAIAVLRQWITEGARWEPGFRFGSVTWEPPLLPRSVTVPPAVGPIKHPIDRILNAYYARQKIAAPQPAADELFLRRAYLDIIGLPPREEDLHQFLDSTDPLRRDHLIESLLSRDHDYAEHWITFWNDLLRNDYAGTGYIDGGRRQITAWLYESLIDNKPYDQFVNELIAPTKESDGFINGIKWRGNVNASQVREVQFAQSISQVFLGINMKCASCHDSFIDRWTLDEAYGLAAIYSTRPLEVHRCDKPTGRVAKARWIFPELGEVDPAAPQPERLKQLASLMTSPRNGRFTRTIVNRIWHRLMGHGIVHPVDAMHTRPWDADLLDYLAGYLQEHQYDLRKVIHHIATSDAYRATAAPAQDWATSEGFVFRGPEARHLTAEQFLDSVWQLTNTAPTSIQAPVSQAAWHGNVEPSAQLKGAWIWSHNTAASAAAGEEATFTRSFVVNGKPKSGSLVITCDNEYIVWINGKRIGADRQWPTVERYNLKKVLRPGENSIVIVGRNAGNSPNAAALFAELIVEADELIRVGTNTDWKAARGKIALKDIDATNWTAAVPLPNQDFLGTAVRQALSRQLSLALSSTPSRVARASLLKSNMLMRSLGRPNREQIVTTRPAVLSTLQAIDLANGAILNSILAQGAERLLSDSADTQRFAFSVMQGALIRQPSTTELELAHLILSETPTKESVQDFLWLIVMHPDFQFVR